MPNSADTNRPLSVLEEREKVIEFLGGEEFGVILDRATKRTVEHLLVRMGFRIEGAGGINDLQEDMAFLRRLRKEELTALEKRMENFEREMLNLKVDQLTHIKICGEQNKQQLEWQKKADSDRADIKRDIRIAVIAFIACCVSIIGYFAVNYVFISVQP